MKVSIQIHAPATLILVKSCCDPWARRTGGQQTVWQRKYVQTTYKNDENRTSSLPRLQKAHH
jgi:hypothetical protein